MQHSTADITVAVLCAAGRSIYHHLPNTIVFDKHRDSCHFAATLPVVAHPPCRTWSRNLAHCAKPTAREAERNLAWFCLEQVIRNGGVFEHPAHSKFWLAAKLPAPGDFTDPFLYTIQVEQAWWGFATRKKTWLLIAGLPKAYLPPIPFRLTMPNRQLASLSTAQRSRTLLPFAAFLCRIARETWWQHKPQPTTRA